MTRGTNLGLALLCSALLGACAAPTATTPPAAAPMTADKPPEAAKPAPDPLLIAGGREWRLVELMGQSVAPVAGGQVPGLSFKIDGQGMLSVSGYGGCNSFGGAAEWASGQRLRFGQLAATLRACLDMSLEQRFMQVLGQADSYHADAKQLQLHRARMAPLARFEPAAN
jgi:heat shock protein HslJ